MSLHELDACARTLSGTRERLLEIVKQDDISDLEVSELLQTLQQISVLQGVADRAKIGNLQEDRRVDVILRQCSVANAEADACGQECEKMQKCIDDLRWHCGEMQNSIVKSKLQMRSSNLNVRQSAHRERAAASEKILNEIEDDGKVVIRKICESRVINNMLEDDFQIHWTAQMLANSINEDAREALGTEPSLFTFKKKHESIRAGLNSTYDRASSTHQETMQQHEDLRAQLEGAFKDGARSLKENLEALQNRLSEESTQADSALQNQVAHHANAMQELESTVCSQMIRLEDQRQSKTTALRIEVAQVRKQIREAAQLAQRKLEVHLEENKTKYAVKLVSAEAAGQKQIQELVHSLEGIKAECRDFQLRADRAKENFRTHSVKSQTYVKNMDSQRRKTLIQLSSRA